LIPAGIEPTAFRFVAQRLNHYATTVPLISIPQSILLSLLTQVLNMEDSVFFFHFGIDLKKKTVFIVGFEGFLIS
jgi:membrane carboxypeptidase/penicillin-binding protein PbpC